MINIINEERDDAHIITVEDPIEYYHKHKKAVVTQREVHVDVPSFAEALRRALRQDPDVVLVGELRDLETMEAAVTAAETGHLVFGTLHTTGAAKTIDRLVNAFPINQQETIRIQLSTVLQAVISQLLVPRIDKPGRIAVYEIMINTPAIAALIRDNKTFRIQSDIQTGAKYGMVTLDSLLMEKYAAGIISREEDGQQITRPHHDDPETGGMGSRSRLNWPPSNPKPEPTNPCHAPFPSSAGFDQVSSACWTTSNWKRSKKSTTAAASPSREILQDFGFLDMEQQLQIIANHLGTEVVNLRPRDLTPEVLSAIPAETARMYKCLPVRFHGFSGASGAGRSSQSHNRR